MDEGQGLLTDKLNQAKELPVRVTRRSNARWIRARVTRQEIRISAPLSTSDTQITHFLRSHHSQLKQVHRQLLHNSHLISYENGSALPFLGKWYPLEICSNACLRGSVGFSGNTLRVVPSLDRTAQISQLVLRWYRCQARSHLHQRCHRLARELEVDYRYLRVKNQSSRWGSCSSQGNLNFNWQLITMPQKVIDYVVVHELAHRRHMNHGPEFWQLVAYHAPHHREARKYLQDYAILF
ncbi:M48 family metallopeptidase [Desulfurispira natronophila]|uniref:YgjP-like metallopeptidase domain-containing protein n=1 Tax=Desulfurispira natronophila TaxID=682562 RepID=A0A7W7Y2X6_9BACT|nr:SprT family zinc-dependent metalloprotease [Desulfurispira natronophila]MBB5021049.1 hypothetical protein [Desulfurispira natronophila]